MRYSEEIAKRIVELTASGEHTVVEICGIVGIDRRSYYRWKNISHPDFGEAIKEAEADKYSARLAMAERGQKKLLEGYESIETMTETDKDGQVVSQRVTKKWVPPHSTLIIHALKSLDPRYNVPERFDHTTGGEKLQPQTPAVYINVKGSKSMAEADASEN